MAALAEHPGAIIRLAEEPPFAISTLTVTPALRQVAWGREQRTVEPRVMQVLIALGRTPGAITSRDALVARCWAGRAVGENAIQRAISLLRHLAAESGAFEIETITRVGYRLLPRPAAPGADTAPAPISAPAPSRRWLLGAGAAAVAASGAGLLIQAAGSPARREARRLHAAGVEVQRRGGPDDYRQAARYFERATMADPGFAEAWGDLAYAQLELIRYTDEAGQAEIAAAVSASAARALQQDRKQRAALLALALLRPIFRNWRAAERRVQDTLVLLPDEPLLIQRLGQILANTGQWRAAVAAFERLVAREPLVPEHQRSLASASWHAGAPGRAEAILERAGRLWPNETDIWIARFNLRLLTGRPAVALRMTERRALGLGGEGPLPAAVAVATARALHQPGAAAIATAEAAILASRRDGEIASFLAIPYLAALGAHESAWALTEDYLYGRRNPQTGERQALSELSARRTDILFVAATRPLRADPRFPGLTARIGLDAYWRASGTRPEPAGG